MFYFYLLSGSVAKKISHPMGQVFTREEIEEVQITGIVECTLV